MFSEKEAEQKALQEMLAQMTSSELEALKSMQYDGYEAQAVPIVHFLDEHGNVRSPEDVDKDPRRPWQRPQQYLGYILGIFDGAVLIDSKQVLDQVIREFGPNAYILTTELGK